MDLQNDDHSIVVEGISSDRRKNWAQVCSDVGLVEMILVDGIRRFHPELDSSLKVVESSFSINQPEIDLDGDLEEPSAGSRLSCKIY